VSSTTYFSNFWKIRAEDSKLICPTLSLILRFKLRLGDYFIWCASSIAPSYKRRLENYSGHQHLTASIPRKKYLEDTFKMKFGIKTPSEVLGRLQYSRAQGLARPGPRDCAHDVHISRIRIRDGI
jgi:hypothetical protein